MLADSPQRSRSVRYRFTDPGHSAAMNFSPVEFATLKSRLPYDLVSFAPELLLVITIVLVLLMRLFRAFDRVHLYPVAFVPVAFALAITIAHGATLASNAQRGEAFGGLLALDGFAAFLRSLLLVFALLALLLGRLTGLPDRRDSADGAVLLLGAILGFMVMVSANHLLMVFVGLEMASLPCYALAAFLKGKRSGSEAALKYVLYGSAASGVALYGLSLLTVRFGGGSMPLFIDGLADMARGGQLEAFTATGLLMLFAGLAFKLSAVPFHAWCPDVFEGAAAEVGALLSIASKTAAFGLLLRWLVAVQQGVGIIDPNFLPPLVAPILMAVAALSMTLGNLAALGQTSLKRLLAYSTIAQAGTMLCGAVALSPDGASAILVYLIGYLPANFVAFGIVAHLRNTTGAETVEQLRGSLKREPALALALALALLSLLGLPPLVGFAGKFQVFVALFEASAHWLSTGYPLLGTAGFVLLGVAVLNTAASAGYYLRLLKVAILDDASDAPEPAPHRPGLVAFLALVSLSTIVLGLSWNPLAALAAEAVRGFVAG